jgi:hypothetical protein
MFLPCLFLLAIRSDSGGLGRPNLFARGRFDRLTGAKYVMSFLFLHPSLLIP